MTTEQRPFNVDFDWHDALVMIRALQCLLNPPRPPLDEAERTKLEEFGVRLMKAAGMEVLEDNDES